MSELASRQLRCRSVYLVAEWRRCHRVRGTLANIVCLFGCPTVLRASRAAVLFPLPFHSTRWPLAVAVVVAAVVVVEVAAGAVAVRNTRWWRHAYAWRPHAGSDVGVAALFLPFRA